MRIFLVKLNPIAVIAIEADDDVTVGELGVLTAPLYALGFMTATESEAEDIRKTIPLGMKVSYRMVDGKLVEVPA